MAKRSNPTIDSGGVLFKLPFSNHLAKAVKTGYYALIVLRLYLIGVTLSQCHGFTLANVYVNLLVFMHIAGTS